MKEQEESLPILSVEGEEVNLNLYQTPMGSRLLQGMWPILMKEKGISRKSRVSERWMLENAMQICFVDVPSFVKEMNMNERKLDEVGDVDHSRVVHKIDDNIVSAAGYKVGPS